MSMLFFSKNSSRVPCTDWDCCSKHSQLTWSNTCCSWRWLLHESTAHGGDSAQGRWQRKVRAGVKAELWLLICCPSRPIDNTK